MKKAYKRSELEQDSTFVQALQRTRAEPGYTHLIWDVAHEDPTILVMIMKRDSFAAPETRGVQQTGLHYPYLDYLKDFLAPPSASSRSPVILINHFSMNPCPADILSDTHPCLEVFSPVVKPGLAYQHLRDAMAPISDVWDKEGRRWLVADAIEPDAQGSVLYCIPWTSVEEHQEAQKNDYFKKGLEQGNAVMGSVRLFAHIHPAP